MVKQGIYFEVLDEEFSEVMDLVSDVVTEYFESRHFTAYLFSNLMREKPVTYEQYKGKVFDTVTHKKSTMTKKNLNDIKEDNERFLMEFLRG